MIFAQSDLEAGYPEARTDVGHIGWLIKKGSKIRGFVFQGYYFDVGTAQSLAEAHRFFEDSKEIISEQGSIKKPKSI